MLPEASWLSLEASCSRLGHADEPMLSSKIVLLCVLLGPLLCKYCQTIDYASVNSGVAADELLPATVGCVSIKAPK